MARKKMAKQTKTRKTAVTGTIREAQQLEKEFRTMPDKLSAVYRNGIVILKHQETSLNSELKKAETLKKAIQNKYALLARAKMKSPAIKKQIASTRKASSNLVKAIRDLTLQLTQIRNKMPAGR